MRVRTQYILIDVFPGGRWITTVSGIFIYIVAISRALVEPPEVRRIIRSSADVQRREGYESSLDAQLSTSIFIFRLINPESRHVPPGGRATHATTIFPPSRPSATAVGNRETEFTPSSRVDKCTPSPNLSRLSRRRGWKRFARPPRRRREREGGESVTERDKSGRRTLS